MSKDWNKDIRKLGRSWQFMKQLCKTYETVGKDGVRLQHGSFEDYGEALDSTQVTARKLLRLRSRATIWTTALIHIREVEG